MEQKEFKGKYECILNLTYLFFFIIWPFLCYYSHLMGKIVYKMTDENDVKQGNVENTQTKEVTKAFHFNEVGDDKANNEEEISGGKGTKRCKL